MQTRFATTRYARLSKCGFSNAYRSSSRHDGAFDLKQATWACRNAVADARDPAVKAALAAQDIAAWIARLPHEPWSRGDWPLPGSGWIRWYLHDDRSLGREPGSDGAAPLVLVADPRAPVPTIGGAISSGEPVMRGGAYDQRSGPEPFGARPPFGPLGEGANVLSFVILPLSADREVVGPVELRLWLACEAPDADIHAKLVDIHPPNEDYPMALR